MTIDDLVTAMADNTTLSKKTMREIIDKLVYIVSAELIEKGEMSIHGLGTWKVKDIPERAGRNPATGEAMTIEARKRVKFKATKSLNDAVQ